MSDMQKDEKTKADEAAPPPANDPGPEAAPAEPPAAEGPPPAGEADAAARLAALEAELAAKTAELAAFKESALRQLAETQNLRRRAENEMGEARKYGVAHFARDTLAVADNLKRALAAAEQAGTAGAGAGSPPADPAVRAQMFDALRQGVELIDREFTAILERHGIKRIDPLGEKFDPNFHQAMFEAEADGYEPGTVMQVIQPGYRLHDRLLRAAMVGVAKAKAAGPPAAAPEEPATKTNGNGAPNGS
jgi:molecular chaperone GrpE